jgi:hypothetical protein
VEAIDPHPVYTRVDHDVTIALKNMGAVGKTFQVYSEPGAQIHRIIHAVKNSIEPD